MLKTVIFDFGNVVAFFDHQRAVQQLLPHTDLNASDLTKLIYYGVLENQYECGQHTTTEVFQTIKKLADLRCSEETFVTAFCDIFWANDAVAALIPRLKTNGYRLVLASNTNDAHYTKYRVQFADTLQHFAAVSVSHEAKARKPDQRFYAHTQNFVEAAPHECVFIDDMPDNIAAAKEFGWHGLVYSDSQTLLAELQKLGVKC